MVHKATDGKGTWYGSLDGESWVLFPVKPMPGDEKYIRANLEPEDASTLAANILVQTYEAGDQRTNPTGNSSGSN